jgi:hypothetical protein
MSVGKVFLWCQTPDTHDDLGAFRQLLPQWCVGQPSYLRHIDRIGNHTDSVDIDAHESHKVTGHAL